jgi:hypothetical protein
MLGNALSLLQSSDEIALLKPGGAQLVMRPVRTPHQFLVNCGVQVTTVENDQLLRECKLGHHRHMLTGANTPDCQGCPNQNKFGSSRTFCQDVKQTRRGFTL